MAIDGYATLIEAQSYFDNRLYADNWDNASEANQNKGLIMGRNMIDDYVTFYDSNNEEITYTQETAPDELKDANCEQSLHLLTLDPTAIPEVLYIGIKSTKGSVFDKSFQADKLSDACIAKLKTIPDVTVEISNGAGGGVANGSVRHR